MERWEMDLREEIRDAFKGTPSSHPKKITKTQVRPLLVFALILLFVMNFVIVERKHPGFIAEKINHCVSYFDVPQDNSPDPLVVALRAIDARLDALELEENEVLWDEFQELRNKVYLQVVVQDENAAISKRLLGQYQEAQEFIHIDPNYRINRMPTHINLTPESEEFLRKRLL